MMISLPARSAEALCVGRCAFATALLVAPESSVRAIGLDSATARRVTWLTRMMAVRDGAIGIGGLVAARRGGGQVPWLVAGAASDAVDAFAVAGALRAGRLRGVRPTLLTVGAAGVAALGTVLACQRGR